MNVASILRTKGADVATATPGTKVSEIAQRMKDKRIGALVVAEDGGPVLGIISERDIVNVFAERGRDLSEATAGASLAATIPRAARSRDSRCPIGRLAIPTRWPSTAMAHCGSRFRVATSSAG